MDKKTGSELRAMMLVDAIEADDVFLELCRRAEVTEAADAVKAAEASAAVPPQPVHPTYVSAIVARTLFSCAVQARFGMPFL